MDSMTLVLVIGLVGVGLVFLLKPFLSNLRKTGLFFIEDWKHSINRYFYYGLGGIGYANLKWRAKPFYNKKGLLVMQLEGIPNSIEINDDENSPDCDIKVIKDKNGLIQKVLCKVDAKGDKYSWDNVLVKNYSQVLQGLQKDSEQKVVEKKIRDAELKDKLEGDPQQNIIPKGKYK